MALLREESFLSELIIVLATHSRVCGIHGSEDLGTS